jgi:DNA-binding NarL/FixJ family response regulator
MARIRVLIVDDFAGWRRYVETELQEHPEFLVVGEAHDGLEAIQKSQELLPDIILLDIGLPKLNGIEAARRLCMILPQTKILFVSADRSPNVVRKALGSGPCIGGFVLKSSAGHDLLPAMQAITQLHD